MNRDPDDALAEARETMPHPCPVCGEDWPAEDEECPDCGTKRKRHYVWDDSYSDGMCGYVVLRDPTTGRKERVSWSVTGAIDSQGAAAAEARRRLAEAKP